MKLIEKRLRPRDICTLKAFENAATVIAASGGSTNGALHLPAMAHEAGIKFDLHDVAKIFKRTPYIANLKPGGKYVAKDLYDVGGVPVLMKALLEGGFLHGDCITVTGKTIAENLKDVVVPTNQDVVVSTKTPITSTASAATSNVTGTGQGVPSISRPRSATEAASAAPMNPRSGANAPEVSSSDARVSA